MRLEICKQEPDHRALEILSILVFMLNKMEVPKSTVLAKLNLDFEKSASVGI